MFEIDSQTIAGDPAKNANVVGTNVAGVMKAFENFVKIQSDAALREVAGKYAYDDDSDDDSNITLRDGGTEINRLLEEKLDERLLMAGIEVVEARINYLAYAPEIAAVMLRRQQRVAIDTVEGAYRLYFRLHQLSVGFFRLRLVGYLSQQFIFCFSKSLKFACFRT